ncbi:MAG: hypothetical protein PHN84_03085 [Desulfuromonadaceae bacterium]|nr:hypothetical protein [Desulfuromonadaceae bacterium]MDD2856336.1 hypothetical protein [Desulfuromonadaceae bacterium]
MIKSKNFISIVCSSAMMVTIFMLCGCASQKTDHNISVSAVPDIAKNQTLVLKLGGAVEGISVGGVDVNIEIPQAVLIKTGGGGILENGVITSKIPSEKLLLTGRLSDKNLRVALISPVGIKDGEILQIKLNIENNKRIAAGDFRIKSAEIIDLKGNVLDNLTIGFDLQP